MVVPVLSASRFTERDTGRRDRTDLLAGLLNVRAVKAAGAATEAPNDGLCGADDCALARAGAEAQVRPSAKVAAGTTRRRTIIPPTFSSRDNRNCRTSNV